MIPVSSSLSNAYFEQLYREDPDPWKFASSGYERDKYAATLSALGNRQFVRACEVGCSIGVFTRALAARCGMLMSIDVVDSALAQARKRCADLLNVEFRRLRAPDEWPEGQFDLFVFSEVLYYLCPDDIQSAARQALGSLSSDGLALLVHWTGPTNYPLSGDDAVEAFKRSCGADVDVVLEFRDPSYRLDLLRRRADKR